MMKKLSNKTLRHEIETIVNRHLAGLKHYATFGDIWVDCAANPILHDIQHLAVLLSRHTPQQATPEIFREVEQAMKAVQTFLKSMNQHLDAEFAETELGRLWWQARPVVQFWWGPQVPKRGWSAFLAGDRRFGCGWWLTRYVLFRPGETPQMFDVPAVIMGRNRGDAPEVAEARHDANARIVQVDASYSEVEFGRLRTALRVRGYRNRMTVHSYRTIAHVAGTLLVRGAERADRVGQAMRCRGFDGRFRSLTEFHTRPADVAAFLATVAVALGLLVWDVLSRLGRSHE